VEKRDKRSLMACSFFFCAWAWAFSGCAALFGWNIHAPAVLSAGFSSEVRTEPQRIALYIDPSIARLVSKNKGGRFADPQTYHIGEAYSPMLIEGFQQGFSEFILLETEPSQDVLRQYAIPYVIYVRPKAFTNDVTLKGQTLGFETETFVFDQRLGLLDRFQTTGISDSKKVFAKKGGPEVNFNAALEMNIKSLILHVQDALRTGRWGKQP